MKAAGQNGALCTAERTLPKTHHIQADLAPPSIGRYQMERDLQPMSLYMTRI
jgi:hypothetical protein